MSEKTVSPCEGCDRNCNYTQCAAYKEHIVGSWEKFRQNYLEIKLKDEQRYQSNGNAWCYENPELTRKWLAVSPCEDCRIKDYCPDDRSCPAYDRWTEDRWKMIKHRLRK